MAQARQNLPESNRFRKAPMLRPDRIPKRTPSRSRRFRGTCFGYRCIERLLRPARNRGYQQYLISVLERIRRASDEANVFLIHVNIQEAPCLPRFIPQMGLQIGELLVELREQLAEIRNRASDARCSGGKPT